MRELAEDGRLRDTDGDREEAFATGAHTDVLPSSVCWVRGPPEVITTPSNGRTPRGTDAWRLSVVGPGGHPSRPVS